MRQDANVVNRIKEVQSFPSLLKFLRDDLDWPITSNDVEDLTFDYSPDELGFDKKMAVKVRSIKQLRPLVKDQPWGIFYIDFEPKRLPVGALRRLLRSLVVKKRGGGDGSQATWNLDDLLFISFHGEESRRTVAFAHFHERNQKQPQLRTFYWDQGETEFASALESLGKLNWPQYAGSAEMAHVWRQYWGAAFRVGHGEVIRDSKALSKKLAQVALKIRQHVFDLLDAEDADKGPLHRLFASFKKALLHDLDEQRFADVLAQTFTYGLLAAKAEIGTKTPLEPGHLAEQIPATNPLLRELFEEFQGLSGVGLDKLDEDLGDLGVDELVDLLNTVDVDEALKNFGRTTMSGDEDPVVYFYELFVREYDEAQWKGRGVFYTPKPVVSFIVRSIHEILQKEFKLEDGLADTSSWDQVVERLPGLAKPDGIRGDEPFVQILDPAVGTGTFLEACVQIIYDTMAAKWTRTGKGVVDEWNHYVPEHLLPRLHGFELMMAPYVVCHMKLGLRLKQLGYNFDSGERLRVFLTNTLEPPVYKQEALIGLVQAIAHEAHEANAVKKELLFTVVTGNPPYAGTSANLTPTAREIVERYKFVEGKRLVERGALQFEKNLQDDYVKFVAWSEERLQSSGAGVLGMICNDGFLETPTLRGMRFSLLSSFDSVAFLDLHGSTKRPIAGDENVFDIQQGVAITVCWQTPGDSTHNRSRADLMGTRPTKYGVLDKATVGSVGWRQFDPLPPLYVFESQDRNVQEEFYRFDGLQAVMPFHSGGTETGFDELLVGFTEEELRQKLNRFCDPAKSDEEVAKEFSLSGKGTAGKLLRMRAAIRADMLTNWSSRCLTGMYRVFDARCYYYNRNWFKTNSFNVMKHLDGGQNWALVAFRQQSQPGFQHAFVTNMLGDKNAVSLRTREINYYFPLFLRTDGDSLMAGAEPAANFGNGFMLKWQDAQPDVTNPRDIFAFIYAVLYSPTYRLRYSDFLRTDFPRIPVSSNSNLVRDLCRLGLSLIQTHLLDSSASRTDKFVGKSGVVVERPAWEHGTVWLDLRRSAGFRNISEGTWSLEIGGYRVLEKWLKDRKGRVLTEADIRHYEQMLYAIEETIRIMAEIDAVIEEHGGWPGAFQASTEEGRE